MSEHDLVAIALETIARTPDYAALVDAAVRGTRVVDDASALVLRARDAGRGAVARVEVTGERTGIAARRLSAEGARRVALLNFANGHRVGGGFLAGARAQEEDLCRCSALYACLSSANAAPFYATHIAAQSPLSSDAVIVSPLVPFFRDDASYAWLDATHAATVLTCAAPERGWLLAQVDAGLGRSVDDAALTALFERRARAIVACAHDDGADALVLGAWGCGAFGNEPARVSAAFASALADLGGCVPRVVFAVWPPGGANHAAFAARFA